jgi:aminoglycoside phosphotransferase (APT) family kinase protein
MDLAPGDRRRLVETSIELLATLHAVDWRSVGLEFLGDHPEAGLDGQLAFWQDSFDWAAQGAENSAVSYALKWLSDNRPVGLVEDVLLWGDARLGNIIFDSECQPAALLDWEMTSIGCAEADVAWWLFMFDHFTSGIGVAVPEGFPSREEVIALYEKHAGRQLRPLHYFEVLAGVRVSILMHRAANLMIQAGQIPPDATMAVNNPASQMLAALLDLPAPDGVAASFIGNR